MQVHIYTIVSEKPISGVDVKTENIKPGEGMGEMVHVVSNIDSKNKRGIEGHGLGVVDAVRALEQGICEHLDSEEVQGYESVIVCKNCEKVL